MNTVSRCVVLMLASMAVSALVWHQRQVPSFVDAQDIAGRLDSGRPVPVSPVTEIINSKEDNATQGLLSINLVIIPYLHYNTSDEAILEREKEYKTVLQRNLNHDLISHVHLLTTNAQETLQRFNDLPNQNKLVVSEVKSIDLARDPFEYISRNLVGKDVMFASADIYLGRGFDRVDPLVMSHQKIMYALSRRVAQEEKCNIGSYSGTDMCLEKYIGCHDVFLFRLTEPLPELFLKELEFDLTSLGIENVVIWLFQNKLKYCTLNPCTILETFHLHCSNVRNKKPARVSFHRAGMAPFTKNLVCSSY